MKYFLIVVMLSASAVGQTLTLGDIKLTLGMSKTEVFNQFAYVSNYGGGRSFTSVPTTCLTANSFFSLVCVLLTWSLTAFMLTITIALQWWRSAIHD
jgi:hypothetical protein